MTTTEGTFAGKCELSIFYRVWQPEGPPRAVVAFCHGFNAHSGHFAWAGERLAAAGYAVFAVDLRGRGRSQGDRFYVEDIQEYVADLAQMIGIAKAAHPGLKLFLLGHSAGGVTSAVYVLDHGHEIDGFVCESFAFQVPAPGFVLSALRGLSHIAPRLGVLKLKNADFSRDPEWVAMMDADPLIHDETQPAATVAALARADDRLHDAFPAVTLPLLILHGTEDHATVWKGSQFFHDTAASTDKTLKLYEGHYHDLLADTGKDGVLADIEAWLAARL